LSTRSESGFSLIEATFALAIVSLVSVAVLASLGAELRAARQVRHSLEAAALAEYEMASLQMLGGARLLPLADSLAGGRFPEPFASYAWDASVRPVRTERELLDVVVRIGWAEGSYSLRGRSWAPPEAGR
jgi:type II secretory pathway pseudopilin PulG